MITEVRDHNEDIDLRRSLEVCDPPNCDICGPLKKYQVSSGRCKSRISAVKKKAVDAHMKVVKLHGLAKNAKRASEGISEVQGFVEKYKSIIKAIPKVGSLVTSISKSLGIIREALKDIVDQEPKLNDIKWGLQEGIERLTQSETYVQNSKRVAYQARTFLLASYEASHCCSINFSAYEYDYWVNPDWSWTCFCPHSYLLKEPTSLGVGVINAARKTMDTCSVEFDISVPLMPDIDNGLLDAMSGIADVIAEVKRWIESIKDAIVQDANYFICCEDVGQALGSIAEFFTDLVGVITCVENGAMGGFLEESFKAMLKGLNPLFDGVNDQIHNYNALAEKLKIIINVDTLDPDDVVNMDFGFNKDTCSLKLKQQKLMFSEKKISFGPDLKQLSTLGFNSPSGEFDVGNVFGAIAEECAAAVKALGDTDADCCSAAKENMVQCGNNGAIVVEKTNGDWTNEKVLGCEGSWEDCCDTCGNTLEAKGLLSEGWDCETTASGIWLKGKQKAQVKCGDGGIYLDQRWEYFRGDNTDAKVHGCGSSSWETCCKTCGQTLQSEGVLTTGWECETSSGGIWLKGRNKCEVTCGNSDKIYLSRLWGNFQGDKTDEKVNGCGDWSWETCCETCGKTLQNKGELRSGWNCEKDAWPHTGIWLKGRYA